MFKTQVDPRAVGRVVLLQSFEHFVASFLWFIRVWIMENCGQFVFYNNIYFLRKQLALRDMLRHSHGL